MWNSGLDSASAYGLQAQAPGFSNQDVAKTADVAVVNGQRLPFQEPSFDVLPPTSAYQFKFRANRTLHGYQPFRSTILNVEIPNPNLTRQGEIYFYLRPADRTLSMETSNTRALPLGSFMTTMHKTYSDLVSKCNIEGTTKEVYVPPSSDMLQMCPIEDKLFTVKEMTQLEKGEYCTAHDLPGFLKTFLIFVDNGTRIVTETAIYNSIQALRNRMPLANAEIRARNENRYVITSNVNIDNHVQNILTGIFNKMYCVHMDTTASENMIWPEDFGNLITERRRPTTIDSVKAIDSFNSPQYSRASWFLARLADRIQFAGITLQGGSDLLTTYMYGQNPATTNLAAIYSGQWECINYWINCPLMCGTKLWLILHYMPVSIGKEDSRRISDPIFLEKAGLVIANKNIRDQRPNVANQKLFSITNNDIANVRRQTEHLFGTTAFAPYLTPFAHYEHDVPTTWKHFNTIFQPSGMPCYMMCLGQVSGAKTPALNTTLEYPYNPSSVLRHQSGIYYPSPIDCMTSKYISDPQEYTPYLGVQVRWSTKSNESWIRCA